MKCCVLDLPKEAESLDDLVCLNQLSASIRTNKQIFSSLPNNFHTVSPSQRPLLIIRGPASGTMWVYRMSLEYDEMYTEGHLSGCGVTLPVDCRH